MIINSSTYNEHSSLVSDEVLCPEPEEPEHHVQPEEGQQEDLYRGNYPLYIYGIS